MNGNQEDTLAAAVTNDTRAKVRASFFILLQSAAEMAAKDIKGAESYTPDVFDGLRESILSAAARLDEPGAWAGWVHPDGAQRRELLAARERLIIVLTNAGLLNEYHKLVLGWMWRGRILGADRPAPPPEEGNLVFYEHIKTVLLPSGEPGRYDLNAAVMSAFMSMIPLRMASARYQDYIRDAVRVMAYKPCLEDAALYKRVFCPMDFLAEDGYFLNEHAVFDKAWAEDPAGLDEDGYRRAYADVKETGERLHIITARLSTLFDAVNALLIVTRFGGPDMIENDEEARTLQGEFKERAAAGRWQDVYDYDAQLDAAAEDAISTLEYGPGEDPFEDVPAGEGTESEERLRGEWKTVQHFFYETGYDYVHVLPRPDRPSDPPAESPEPFLDELLPYISDCVADLDNRHRRYLRQMFLRQLPCPFDYEAYRDYFLSTYASLDDANRYLLMVCVRHLREADRYDDVSIGGYEDHAYRDV